MRCCDGIFLPSLYFTNADAFPEDREIGYGIDTTANGAVVWETTVHALYYQVGSCGAGSQLFVRLLVGACTADSWHANLQHHVLRCRNRMSARACQQSTHNW